MVRGASQTAVEEVLTGSSDAIGNLDTLVNVEGKSGIHHWFEPVLTGDAKNAQLGEVGYFLAVLGEGERLFRVDHRHRAVRNQFAR